MEARDDARMKPFGWDVGHRWKMTTVSQRKALVSSNLEPPVREAPNLIEAAVPNGPSDNTNTDRHCGRSQDVRRRR